MEIIVIGPEPPCIRCKTSFKYALEVAKQFPGKVEARKLTADSTEAQRYGRVAGGHTIADDEKVEHGHERIEDLMRQINELSPEDPYSVESTRNMMDDIDKELIPVKEKATEKGYLMTPVVVVNGIVKSAGFVPSREKMIEWIKAELK